MMDLKTEELVKKLRDEVTGEEVARLAGKALRDPHGCTPTEIRKLAASALTQSRGVKRHKVVPRIVHEHDPLDEDGA